MRFETELLEGVDNWQGNAVVNYTSHDAPFTRIIEHKHFEFGRDEEGNPLPDTVISREYSSAWQPGDEPYYPVNDERNNALYAQYAKLAAAEETAATHGVYSRLKTSSSPFRSFRGQILESLIRFPKTFLHSYLRSRRI